MEIKITRCEDFIIYLIAICGRIYDRDIKLADFSDAVVNNAISRLKKKKYIYKSRVKNRITLTKEGEEYLKNYNKDLYEVFLIINNNNKGTSELNAETRLTEYALGTKFIFESDIVNRPIINNFKVKIELGESWKKNLLYSEEYRKKKERENLEMLFGGTNILPEEAKEDLDLIESKESHLREMDYVNDYFTNLDLGERYFVNAKILKNDAGNGKIYSIINSRSIGMYFAGGNSFTVYAATRISEGIKTPTEKKVLDLTRRFTEGAYGIERRKRFEEKHENPVIVVYPDRKRKFVEEKTKSSNRIAIKKKTKIEIRWVELSGLELIKESLIANRSRERIQERKESLMLSKSFSPVLFTREYYLLPNNEHGNIAINLLSMPNFESKLAEYFYHDDAEGCILRQGKGIRPDGYVSMTDENNDCYRLPSWELSTCGFWKAVESLRSYSKLHFFCYSWQVEIIEFLKSEYGNKKTKINYSEIDSVAIKSKFINR